MCLQIKEEEQPLLLCKSLRHHFFLPVSFDSDDIHYKIMIFI